MLSTEDAVHNIDTLLGYPVHLLMHTAIQRDSSTNNHSLKKQYAEKHIKVHSMS